MTRAAHGSTAKEAAETFLGTLDKAKKKKANRAKKAAERAKKGAEVQLQNPASSMSQEEQHACTLGSRSSTVQNPVQVKIEKQQNTNHLAIKRHRDETSLLSEPFDDLKEATAPFTTEDQTGAAAAGQACAAVKRLRDDQIYPSGHEIPIVTVNEGSLRQQWDTMATAPRCAFPQGIKRPRPRGEPGLGGCMHTRV